MNELRVTYLPLLHWRSASTLTLSVVSLTIILGTLGTLGSGMAERGTREQTTLLPLILGSNSERFLQS